MQIHVLVPLVTYPDADSDGIVAQAVALAAGLGAALNVLAVNADIPDVSNVLSSFLLNTPEMIRQAEATSRNKGNHLIALFEAKAKAADVAITTSSVTAPLTLLAETAVTRARYHDLVFVGCDTGRAMSQSTAEAMIFGAGRPTILLPETPAGEPAIPGIDHVAIAWDGTRVAARAVGDALPFLTRAKQISVITVVDEKPLKEKNAGEQLAEGLRSRGLNARAITAHSNGRLISESLQQTALENGCQLLVMGGYGHSRIRDFVLGGATRGVLSDLAMPVLISH